MEALSDCRCQAFEGGSKVFLRSCKQSWRVVSASLTIQGKFILLVEALVRPLSHFSNGCNCWSSSIMEALTNCRCQAIMGDSKGALKISCQAWSVMSNRLTLVSVLILLVGDLALPWSHLSNGCTCLSR